MRRTALLAFVLILAACQPASPTQRDLQPIRLTLTADGATRPVTGPPGATVRDVLSAQGMSLNPLDRVRPSENSLVADGVEIVIVRVTEKFEVVPSVLPFERQTVVNHALPEGQTQLQSGKNGLQEDTYRIAFEDGVEVSRSLVKSEITAPPVPEIVMVGGQPTYAPVDIAGTLAYISSGNAWVMRGNSNARQLLTSTGDLDGHVFWLSPDGRWLLFTRDAGHGEEDAFNSLWALSTVEPQPQPIDLKTENVLYAEWSPVGDLTFAYSTGLPQADPPGYTAHNNLFVAQMDPQGKVGKRTPVRDSSCGGQSAWWGTNYAWSPDGLAMAFSQANLVGTIALKTKACTPLLEFTAVNTYNRSAWLPPVAWSPGGLYLYTVYHEGDGDSPAFDLAALSSNGDRLIRLIHLSGIFASPQPSPPLALSGDERPYRLAFLQAGDAENSAQSKYSLVVMDRDGSNPTTLLAEVEPPAGQDRALAWSPDAAKIAFISGGNLWVVDVATGRAQQLTGDAATIEPRWTK